MGRVLDGSPVLLGQAQAELFAKNVYVRFVTLITTPRPGGTHFLGYRGYVLSYAGSLQRVWDFRVLCSGFVPSWLAYSKTLARQSRQ
eukprot:3889198-Alexandrium_andersonii.AAC.1